MADKASPSLDDILRTYASRRSEANLKSTEVKRAQDSADMPTVDDFVALVEQIKNRGYSHSYASEEGA